MKVIDLLNKIANGEEVPKKIKFQNKIYHFNRVYMDYESDIQEYRNADVKENYYIFSEWCPMSLNDEVEIIEEDNKIHKINKTRFIANGTENEGKLFHYCYDLEKKLGEVIDAINNLGGSNER